MEWFYLLGLTIAISCLGLIDWKYKLAFYHDFKRTAATLFIAISLFVVWDILGINLGIFFHGGSELTLPYRIIPELPIEELFFLMLLCYVTLIVFRFMTTGSQVRSSKEVK
jgi:lycopene cyclase domain-containing protein